MVCVDVDFGGVLNVGVIDVGVVIDVVGVVIDVVGVGVVDVNIGGVDVNGGGGVNVGCGVDVGEKKPSVGFFAFSLVVEVKANLRLLLISGEEIILE